MTFLSKKEKRNIPCFLSMSSIRTPSSLFHSLAEFELFLIKLSQNGSLCSALEILKSVTLFCNKVDVKLRTEYSILKQFPVCLLLHMGQYLGCINIFNQNTLLVCKQWYRTFTCTEATKFWSHPTVNSLMTFWSEELLVFKHAAGSPLRSYHCKDLVHVVSSTRLVTFILKTPEKKNKLKSIPLACRTGAGARF